jgi:homoserine kinase type II
MAVYTPLSDQQISALIARYDVGDFVSATGIMQGVENTNYKIETTAGRYILTLYEHRVDPADLPFFFAFTNHLVEHGVNGPKTLAGKDGQLIHSIDGHAVALISFLDGVDIKANEITASHCHSLGGVVARMHDAATIFHQTRANTLSLSGWGELVTATKDGADAVEPGLAKLITDELSYLTQNWPGPSALPRGIIHADIFPDNVFFQNGAVSGVIDFYFSCDDFFAYDLSLVINAWCFGDNGLDKTRWAALRDGYRAQREIGAAEWDALSILCRGAALRILLTRLQAWINHPAGALVKPKDPKEYSAILRWHQNEKIGR